MTDTAAQTDAVEAAAAPSAAAADRVFEGVTIDDKFRQEFTSYCIRQALEKEGKSPSEIDAFMSKVTWSKRRRLYVHPVMDNV
jgi:hypothetical protein